SGVSGLDGLPRVDCRALLASAMQPLLLALGLLPGGARDLPRVLFLTHSAGFRHPVVTRPSPDVLSLAESELRAVAAGAFEVEATADCSSIAKENLARFDAVVFYTTGELPLDGAQKSALLEFVRSGGGFVGIHSAADTLYGWDAYGGML